MWTEKLARLYVNRSIVGNITFFITGVTPILVLGYGGMSVITGTISLGTLIGFFSYINFIYEPIDKINESIIEFQSIDAIAQRFFATLNTPKEADNGLSEFPSEYPISYQNVSFAYKDSSILEKINFEIKQNELLAIVGLSGSGKSTIINLLSKFYHPQTGQISVNNQNINSISLNELRENIRIVRQGDYLFNMTIKENIFLGNHFSEKQLEESINQAGIGEFISSLPDGYETLVGERGSKLSDGERQRICLARALIRNPKVLVLDEATSAIDANIEEKIFEQLKKSNRTIILISHRLSTIAKADRILVIDGGKNVASGKHKDLLVQSPKYKNIIYNQVKEGDPECA